MRELRVTLCSIAQRIATDVAEPGSKSSSSDGESSWMREFFRVQEDSLQETRPNEDSVSTFYNSITANMGAVHFSMDCRDKIAHKVKHLLEPKLQHLVYTEKQEAIVDFIAGWLLSQLYNIQGGGLHVCGKVNHDHYEERHRRAFVGNWRREKKFRANSSALPSDSLSISLRWTGLSVVNCAHILKL